MQISGINVIALYNTDTNMSHMLQVCYVKLKEPATLKMVAVMSVHLATGHDLYHIGLPCCLVYFRQITI